MKSRGHHAGIGDANGRREQAIGADHTGLETALRRKVEVDPLGDTVHPAIRAARAVNSDRRSADTAERPL